MKPTEIFTVTTVNYRPRKLRSPDLRTWGFFSTRGQATQGLKKSCDTEAGYYNYAVIEKFREGIFASAKLEIWFRWTGKGWSRCPKPRGLLATINFAIG